MLRPAHVINHLNWGSMSASRCSGRTRLSPLAGPAAGSALSPPRILCVLCSWVAAAFVPLCTRNRNDRLAGLASTVAMLVLVVIGIILGVTSKNWRYY